MNLSQFHYLIAFSRCGSYADAAKECYVDTSTVTKSISSLEKEINEKIVDKVNGRVVLTKQGKLIAEKVSEILLILKDINRHVGKDPNGRLGADEIYGTVNIVVLSSPYEGDAIYKAPFITFQEKYPNVKLNVKYGKGSYCRTLFDSENGSEIDALIVAGRYEDSGYSWTQLHKEHASVVVSKNHPLALKQAVTLVELSDYPVAVPYDVGDCYRAIKSRFAERNLEVRYEENLVQTHEYDAFIHKKFGIGFVICSDQIKSNFSEVLLLSIAERDAIQVPIYLAARQENELMQAVKRHLLEVLRK